MWASRRARIALIAIAVWHVIGLIGLLCAPMASADPTGGDSPSKGADGSLSMLMGWMNLKDSHGINTADYYLSIDQGGATHPLRLVFAWFTILEYSAYRIIVMFAIWVIRQVLSFRWLQVIVSPVSDLGDALSVLTGRVNMVPLGFTLAGAAIALWIFRGRYTAAAYEGLMALVIGVAAVGFLAHPIETIAGPHGMIVKTKDIALQTSAGLANNGNTDIDPQANVEHLTASLTDTFLRKPTQLITFGAVLDTRPDGGACATAFDNAFLHEKKKGALAKTRDSIVGGIKDLSKTLGDAADAVLPGGDDPTATVRDSVGKCPGGGPMKSYAAAPGVENMMAAGFLLPAASLVFLFALLLAGRVLLAVAWALFNALKLIPITPAAVAPMFRGSLMHALADVAMSLCQVAFAIIYIAGYAVMVDAIFDRSTKAFIETVSIVDIALIIAVLIFWKGMGRLRKLSDRLAEIMARRPGVGPVAIARRTPTTAADVMARAHATKNAARGAATVGKKVAKVGKLAGEAAGAVASGGSSVAASAATRLGKTAAVTATKSAAKSATKAAAQSVAGAAVGGKPTVSPDEWSPQHAAAKADALREALSSVVPARRSPSSLRRPGSSIPPTARRAATAAATGGTSDTGTDTRTPVDRVKGVAGQRTATTPTPRQTATPARSTPAQNRPASSSPAAPTPTRRAPAPSGSPAPASTGPANAAARRSPSGSTPTTVGSTRLR